MCEEFEMSLVGLSLDVFKCRHFGGVIKARFTYKVDGGGIK